MTQIWKALAWAGVIIIAAIVMNAQGMSDGASFGVIAGLSGAAWGSIHADAVCGRGCLQ
ncbi:MAG: hypothetical protein AAGL68_01070 [Pseudomonadota bacterium]